MIKISVATRKTYDVIIAEGSLKNSAELIKEYGLSGKAAIISDDIVYGLFGKTLEQSLEKSSIEYCSFVFQNGENSKNMQTVSDILEFLAENALSRSDYIIALGGGVVGDIAGFCAAIYLRGIKFVQIPTTYLAAIDSSVGGKTGVDLSSGKNLAGAFWQPELVICNPETLQKLPEEIFAEGIAETIKYAIIADRELYETLQAGKLQENLLQVIEKCIRIKSEIVSEDEFDTGRRQLLNFGHTIAHAIEKRSNFTIRHGQAVAIGMLMISQIAWRNDWSKEDCTEKIRDLLLKYKLPTETDYSLKELLNIMLLDKKRQGNKINLIIPEKIGEAKIKSITINELLEL